MTTGLNTDTFESLRQALLNDSEVREMISMRAYEIYLARGGHAGHQVEDWLRAEAEILTLLIEEEVKGKNKLVEPASSLPEPGFESTKKPRKTTAKASKSTKAKKTPSKEAGPSSDPKKEPRRRAAQATVRSVAEPAAKAKSTVTRKKKPAVQRVDEAQPVKKKARSA
ncbi:MAG TPA: DUF2934 domain-containing protein [Blastocatellia bacterium]|nr:DUF2934 domain-containing protein [Blastocatellia bacterium]